MNERMLELARQVWPDPNISHANHMKFAELIVRECVECLKPLSRNHSMVGAAQDTIREHFGVE
jgi:hypothetical protein